MLKWNTQFFLLLFLLFYLFAEGSIISVGNDVKIIFVLPQPLSESNR
jgi:hypothetical protein